MHKMCRMMSPKPNRDFCSGLKQKIATEAEQARAILTTYSNPELKRRHRREIEEEVNKAKMLALTEILSREKRRTKGILQSIFGCLFGRR